MSNTAKRIKKRHNHLCKVVGCIREVASWKRGRDGRTCRSKYCHTHKKQKDKVSNPLSYWFSNLKQNARRRKKVFTLTRADFKQFCDETGYLLLKGKEAGKYTIDRKDETKGYEPGNLQIMEHNDNTSKYFSYKRSQGKPLNTTHA